MKSFFEKVVFTIFLTAFFGSNSQSAVGYRFIVGENGTVLDKKFNVVWKRCALGQQYKNSKCVGSAKKIDMAMETGSLFKRYGYKVDEWRLPTATELASLVECTSGEKSTLSYGEGGQCLGEFMAPTTNTALFPDTPTDAAFWSSTICGGFSLATNFTDGWSGCYTLNDGPQYVRLVKGSENE